MTLIVRDLLESKELDSKAMAAVRGGEGLDNFFQLVENKPQFTSTVDQDQFASIINIDQNPLTVSGKGGLGLSNDFDNNVIHQNQFGLANS